jgi:hypothetical protein
MKTQIKQLLYGILVNFCLLVPCTSLTLAAEEFQWPPMLFVAVFVLTPICVAAFSAFVARFHLPSQLNMSEMG